jgi:O-antigen/teichoic acid export membrane protein
MSEITELIKSNAWLSFASIVSRLTSALALPVLARLLGPKSLGIYNIVISLAQAVQGFSGLGIEIAIQRNGAKHQTIGTEAVGRLFGVSLILICATSAITSLGILCFRQALADRWLLDPGMANWLGVAGIVALLQPLGTVPLLFLAGLQNFRAYAVRSSLGLIFSNIIIVISAWYFGLQGAVVGLIISTFCQIIWSYIIVKPILKANRIRLHIEGFIPEMYSILKFSLPYYLGTHFLYSSIDLPLMGLVSNYSGIESLGYIRSAQMMASLVGFIPLSTAPSVISHLSANIESGNQSESLKSVHLRIVWIFLLLSTSIICLFLPDLMIWLFGSSYQPAIILAWLFLWASVLTGISSVLIQYLTVEGKTITIGWISATAAFAWVLTAIALIPKYGALGFMLSYIFSSIVEVILLARSEINTFKIEDLSLLKNLTLITGFLFSWSSTIFFFGFSGSPVFALTTTVIALSSMFIFIHSFHHEENLKMKKFLQSNLFKA